MAYFDLGTYRREIKTTSPEAKLWFDRGLIWIYGFNHAEAIVCFQKALEHDSNCAMAWWGIAYAAGPNYNQPWDEMDPVQKEQTLHSAFDATQAALKLVDDVSPLEAALIGALSARYPQRDPIDDHSAWDRDFTTAMRRVFDAYPEDLEVRTALVDAILNETPWRMWDLQSGEPAVGARTLEAVELMESGFRDMPEVWDHPGFLHLYIHLMELSPTPQKALQAADRLRDLVPDTGHLIHMPTHIYVQCGQYHDAMAYNQKAVAVDRKYLAHAGAMNIYTIYRAHDLHFAIYGALFLGQYAPAIEAAEELCGTIPEEFLRVPSPPIADLLESYLSMKQHVLVRFGKWQEIIDQELPSDRSLYSVTSAMILYAKAVAYSALGLVTEAERTREGFLAAKVSVPASRRLHNNLASNLLGIAEEMLNGELEYRRANYDVAFAHLRKSVELADNLPYDEPWGWMQPPRHALGALLLEQGHVDEAEAVYRSDLGLDGKLNRSCHHPDNIWSLHGLHECLAWRGDTVETPQIKQRLDLAQARADVQVRASCFCRRKAEA